MKSLRLTVWASLVSALAFAQAQPAPPSGDVVDSQGRVVIGGQGVGDPRTPIAIPYFASAPGSDAAAKEMAEVLAYDLDFTGLFKILLPSTYPKNFAGMPSDVRQIDFEAWRTTPADYLVHGYVYTQGSQVVGEFRLFDVATGQEIYTGKRLSGDASARRLVAHQYADEVTRQVTGTPGVATSRIVFAVGTTGKKEIWIADYDGANAKQLTQHNDISIQPEISPDGTKLAYVSYRQGYPWLYLLNIATGAVSPISRKVGVNIAPGWAPDGNSLVLALSIDGNTEIYRINQDGSGARRLTNDKSVDTSPCFSPDGRQIAFVKDVGNSPQIYVMNSDGSSPRRLSYGYGKAYDPAWSPDGTKIAYTIQSGGFRIAMMNADGTGATVLTTTGQDEGPSWSPDSRHIIYHNTSAKALFTVNVETGKSRRVPNLPAGCTGASWGPRRQ